MLEVQGVRVVELQMQKRQHSRQHPLLPVEGLRSSEALNVDTVLELMERWWDGVDGLAEGSGDDGDCLRRCFLDAALGAMCSHEDRHPNRPVHGSGSQK